MQHNVLLVTLGCLAIRVSCSPVPVVLVDTIEPAGPRETRTQAPVVSERPRKSLPQLIVMDADDDDNDDEDESSSFSDRPIDNKPVTPSTTAHPSDVLDSPHPVSSMYLLSLSRQGPRTSHQDAAQRPDDVLEGEQATAESQPPPSESRAERGRVEGADGLDRVADDDAVFTEAVFAEAPGTSVPCSYPSIAKERGDMVAVSLFAIFLLLVVVAEVSAALLTRSAVLTRLRLVTVEVTNRAAAVRLLVSGRGSIRLDDEPRSPPPSFWADAPETRTLSSAWDEEKQQLSHPTT